MTLPKPGVYWVSLDGWRLARLSYRKRGRVAVLETRSGAERVKVADLFVRPVVKDDARRFEEALDAAKE